MHIAVDMDDVVCEFTKHILACWKTEYGEDIDYDSLGWSDLLDGTRGPTWDWLKSRDWLWAKVPAVEGAIGGIQRLRDAGHFVEGLTSKPDWARWTVWAWCGKWRPPFDQLTVVPTGQPKYLWSTADLLVDDRMETIQDWCKAPHSSLVRPGILFDRPWNHGRRPEGSYRAANWAQVLTIVESLSAIEDERKAA